MAVIESNVNQIYSGLCGLEVRNPGGVIWKGGVQLSIGISITTGLFSDSALWSEAGNSL